MSGFTAVSCILYCLIYQVKFSPGLRWFLMLATKSPKLMTTNFTRQPMKIMLRVKTTGQDSLVVSYVGCEMSS